MDDECYLTVYIIFVMIVWNPKAAVEIAIKVKIADDGHVGLGGLLMCLGSSVKPLHFASLKFKLGKLGGFLIC